MIPQLLDGNRLTLLRSGTEYFPALLAALDSGQVANATLDVFRTEPLPQDHPFWTHPQITVTPHIAADTRPHSAARVLVENIRRSEAGAPLLHLVDRALGY